MLLRKIFLIRLLELVDKLFTRDNSILDANFGTAAGKKYNRCDNLNGLENSTKHFGVR